METSEAGCVVSKEVSAGAMTGSTGPSPCKWCDREDDASPSASAKPNRASSSVIREPTKELRESAADSDLLSARQAELAGIYSRAFLGLPRFPRTDL